MKREALILNKRLYKNDWDILLRNDRKLLIKKTLLLLVSWCWISIGYAHVNEHCLALLAQSAAELKACVVDKSSENCRQQRHLLTDQVEMCRQQGYSDDDIALVISEGEATIKGKASYHIQAPAEDRADVATTMAQGNIKNFNSLFSGIKSYPVEDLAFGANLGGCHQAFLAKGDRYNFSGHLTLKRYQEGSVDKSSRQELYFFTRMTAGVCYKAPYEGQLMNNGEPVVINLPKAFFPYLQRAVEIDNATAVIVRCESKSMCADKKRKALKLQVDYQATYLRIKRLQACESSTNNNRWYRRIIRLKPKKEELPTYCMEKDLERNLNGLFVTLDKLGAQLFDSL